MQNINDFQSFSTIQKKLLYVSVLFRECKTSRDFHTEYTFLSGRRSRIGYWLECSGNDVQKIRCFPDVQKCTNSHDLEELVSSPVNVDS